MRDGPPLGIVKVQAAISQRLKVKECGRLQERFLSKG
jgi:hypothetical protein